MDELKEKDNTKPPVMGSWKNLYILVLSVLIVLILVFYAITQYYK